MVASIARNIWISLFPILGSRRVHANYPNMDLHFSWVFPLDDEIHFLSEKLIFINWNHYLFLFIFKRENTIINKTLKNDSLFLEKHVFKSSSLGSEAKLPIKKVP